MSFLPSPTTQPSFSRYTHNCTLKIVAENSSETLATLHQNTPSHSSAAGYLTYNIKRQLERSARQWYTPFMLRHDVTSLRSDLSVTRTGTHRHALCLLSESGLYNATILRESSIICCCCTSYCAPTVYCIY
jgi:hypothetical protein